MSHLFLHDSTQPTLFPIWNILADRITKLLDFAPLIAALRYMRSTTPFGSCVVL